MVSDLNYLPEVCSWNWFRLGNEGSCMIPLPHLVVYWVCGGSTNGRAEHRSFRPWWQFTGVFLILTMSELIHNFTEQQMEVPRNVKESVTVICCVDVEWGPWCSESAWSPQKSTAFKMQLLSWRSLSVSQENTLSTTIWYCVKLLSEIMAIIISSSYLTFLKELPCDVSPFMNH